MIRLLRTCIRSTGVVTLILQDEATNERREYTDPRIWGRAFYNSIALLPERREAALRVLWDAAQPVGPESG